MSTITYKFRNAKSDFHTITFEEPAINVLDFKKGVVSLDKTNLITTTRTSDFDLVVTNQQTGEEYRDNNTLIPRNTLVVIHRVPATSMKAAKLFEPLTNPVVPPNSAFKKSILSIADAEFGSPLYSTDNKKKIEVKSERAAMFHVTEQNRAEMVKPILGSCGFLTQPGPNYVCHRCGISGHWIRNCPTNNDKDFVPVMKRLMNSTGLPTTASQVPVEKPGTQNPQRIIVNGQVLMAEEIDLEETELIPASFRCDLCNGILRGATLVPCCKKSFCVECIKQHLHREESDSKCPTCASILFLDDELEKNESLQKRVDDFRKQQESIRHQRKRIKTSTAAKSSINDEYIQKKSIFSSAIVQKPTTAPKFTSFGTKLSSTTPLSCLNCHESGHVFKDCPKLQDVNGRNAQSSRPPPVKHFKKPKAFLNSTPQPIPPNFFPPLSYPPNPLFNLLRKPSPIIAAGAHSFPSTRPLTNQDKILISTYFSKSSVFRKKPRRKRRKSRVKGHSSSRSRTPKRRRHYRERSKRFRKSRKKYYTSSRSRSHYSPSRSPSPKRRVKRSRYSYSRSPTPKRRSKRGLYSRSRSPTPRRHSKRSRYSCSRSVSTKRRSKKRSRSPVPKYRSKRSSKSPSPKHRVRKESRSPSPRRRSRKESRSPTPKRRTRKEYRSPTPKRRFKKESRSPTPKRRSEKVSRSATPKRRQRKKSRSATPSHRSNKKNRSPTPTPHFKKESRRSPTPKRQLRNDSKSPVPKRHSEKESKDSISKRSLRKNSRSPAAKRRTKDIKSPSPKRQPRSRENNFPHSRSTTPIKPLNPLKAAKETKPTSPKVRRKWKETPSVSPDNLDKLVCSQIPAPESKKSTAKTTALSKPKLNGKKKATKSRKKDFKGGAKNVEIVRRSDLPPKKKMIKGSHRIILKRDSASKLGKQASKDPTNLLRLSSRRRVVTSRFNSGPNNNPIVFGPFLPRKQLKLVSNSKDINGRSSL